MAVHLFRTRGYESARLEDVADELGITKAAIFYYFPKKIDLLIEICERAIDEAMERQAAILASAAAPEERLRLAVADHIAGMATNAAVWNVFFREFDVVSICEARRSAIAKRLSTFGQRFERLLDEGISKGIFRPVDSRLAANAILGMLNWSNRWIQADQAEDVSEVFNDLISHALFAPATKAGPRP